MNLSEVKKTFVYERLLPTILCSSAPSALNVRDEFRIYIRDSGISDILSAEIANEQFGSLVDYLENHLVDWDAQGIPRPITRTDQEHVFLAWPHASFLRYSGLREAIDQNFCELFEYLQELDGKQFLIVCALWLKILGCRRIFICDSRGDEGVDVLGLLEEGALRSLVAVVQAKTASQPIGRGLVLAEYGKYKMLPHTEKYVQYRRALEVDSRIEGATWSYMILANQTFNWSARKVAARLGILLRSVHQITFLLAKRYAKLRIENEVDRLTPTVRADLAMNVFQQLRI